MHSRKNYQKLSPGREYNFIMSTKKIAFGSKQTQSLLAVVIFCISVAWMEMVNVIVKSFGQLDHSFTIMKMEINLKE